MWKGWRGSEALDCIPGVEEKCVLGGTDSVVPSSPLSPHAGHISPHLSNLSCVPCAPWLLCHLPSLYQCPPASPRCPPELTMEITTQALWPSYVQTSPRHHSLGCHCPVPHHCPRIFFLFCLFSWLMLPLTTFFLIFPSYSRKMCFLSCLIIPSFPVSQVYFTLFTSLTSTSDLSPSLLILDNSLISKP